MRAAIVIVLIVALGADLVTGFVGIAGTSTVTIPLSFTYIVKVGGPNIYQAFITGTTGLPLFTEANFTMLMDDDVLDSAACVNGCSITVNPGMYNQTQRIIVDESGVSIAGFPSSVMVSQNNVFSGTFRPMIDVTANSFVMSGIKIEDFNRDFVAGVTGDGIDIESSGSGLIQSMTIQNASSTGINILGANVIVTTSTIAGPTPLPKVSGNFGINIGGTGSHIRIFLNTVSRFNGSDVSGIQILLTTQAFGTFSAGPATIAENVITDNALEPNTDVQCASQHCPGIMIRGSRPLWDTVSLTGNVIKDTQAVHTQFYGISITSTNYNNLTITGNSLGISASGTTLNLGVTPLASWTISDNPGFNPQPVRGPLTAGASPFTYTNIDGYREQLAIISVAGTASLVCRGVTQILTNGETTPMLNTADTCIFTWAVTAPTYDVLPT